MMLETFLAFSSFWPGSSDIRMRSVSMAATTILCIFPLSSSQKSGSPALDEVPVGVKPGLLMFQRLVSEVEVAVASEGRADRFDQPRRRRGRRQ